jgi:acyl-CoA reductase-like NAD-dependent aldehyde dehydrogenase
MTTVINNHNAFRVDWMPFGGHYQSGLGMGGVKYAIEEMTRLKQVIIKY